MRPSLIAASARLTMALYLGLAAALAMAGAVASGQVVVDSTYARDAKQPVDEAYTAHIEQYTTGPNFLSPLVDYLPASKTVPTPAKVLGDVSGAPNMLPYAEDVYKYFRLLAASSPRVQVFTIGHTEEGREMIAGRGFAFVARQYGLSTESKDIFIDLFFYNFLLKCFVLFEFKSGELTHHDIGQMDMYVRMMDDLKRGDGDNPTVGIIHCAQKDASVVRYSVLHGNEQIFASRYKLVLPTEDELRAELDRERNEFAKPYDRSE